MSLLRQRSADKSICPSEVLPKGQGSDPQMMEHIRRSARLLAAEGLIEITQGGKPVETTNFVGPIRLRLPRP